MSGRLSPDKLPPLRELGDLKRIFSADREGSIAERLFLDGWRGLAAGVAPDEVMARVCAAAIAAGRLGDLDRTKLVELGLKADADAILGRAFDEIGEGLLEPSLAERLRPALAKGARFDGEPPEFALTLARQPRAGVTCPGKPRIMLTPAENHAEHCMLVTLYGVIAAPWQDADPTDVFLAGMSHHFHSAMMPDSGFSGEILLGDKLDAAIGTARDAAMRELDEPLAGRIRDALQPIGGDETPEARAFHVGDVLDRVFEIEQHLTRAAVTMDLVLGEYGLVHDGPVKAYHDTVLAEAGLG